MDLYVLIVKIRQRFCKHKFVKHWDKNAKRFHANSGDYVLRCTKCNKTIGKDR